MSFAISPVVLPIAKTIGEFLFGRFGDSFIDTALIRRRTKKILLEDKKKINCLFQTEPEKAKIVEKLLFEDIFQDTAFLFPVTPLPDDKVELAWGKYCELDGKSEGHSSLEDKALLIACIDNHNALIGKYLLDYSDRLLLGVLERDRADLFGYIGKTLNDESALQYNNERLDYLHKQLEGILHALRMDQRHYKILLALYSVAIIALTVILAVALPSVLPKLTWYNWQLLLILAVFLYAFLLLFVLFMKSYHRVEKYENRITYYVENLWTIHFNTYQGLFSELYPLN